MTISLDIRKTLEENAAIYFEKSKKAKKKFEGATKALERTKNELATAEMHLEKKPVKEQAKKEWYEKFRWFFSSSGFLVIGGKDATTNEIVIKKHAEKGDLVFHTDLAGSPFAVIKSLGKEIDDETKKQAALFCACFSRAWQRKLGFTEVYCITPDQVKKELGLPKGSFMIHGKRAYQSPKLELALGLYNGKVVCAPVNAVASYTDRLINIKPGNYKKTEIAKLISKKLNVEIDDVVRVLPTGETSVA